MRKLVYDVAVSVDGFICRPDGDISDFIQDGPHVDDYRARLETYDTVVMGRRTYEFGYQFGLDPGSRAYPHMDHFIFSSSLRLDHEHQLNIVSEGADDVVRELKRQAGSEIYLCGGSIFAGYLLQEQLIDRLILKVNPVVIGEGLGVFSSPASIHLKCTDSRRYDNGVILAEYDLVYEQPHRIPSQPTTGADKAGAISSSAATGSEWVEPKPVTVVAAKLEEIVEAMDALSNGFDTYLSKESGKVVAIPEEYWSYAEFEDEDEENQRADWERKTIAEARDIIARPEQYLELPSSWDINEYRIMERFCWSRNDPQEQEKLLKAIQGKGAFRRFKDRAHDLGVIDDWYEYKTRELTEQAVDWCEANDVEVVRGD